ncbi:MAG: HlyD family efflux transporter periplasmic adaptor subunit [Pirellulales bacterium]|nr:HlyD family efflux transporter periplasmic adaptor subunit [Pirellulales bacterium]
MSPVTHANLSAADRPLALRARCDLQVVPVMYAGQSAYVVKDPLTLEMFHLTATEHFLLESLDATTSLRMLRQEFQKRFAPQRINLEVLQQGLNQLYNQGLLLSTASGQGEQLRERGQRQLHQQRIQSLMSLLSFRLGSFDATRWIDTLHARIRWIFSWPALVGVLILVFYVAALLLAKGGTVVEHLPGLLESMQELAQPRYWFLWLGTIALVKVLHELAHAVTCQQMGGRCHEIGVLLLACLPCLYCDVSDVWRLPSKWGRMAGSSAGMLVEFVLALSAFVLWWHTQPGLLHTWCFSIVVGCSVGTFLVNANPLLRYDGYYILSDLVEVPNLASRAQGLLPTKVQRWLLGQLQAEDTLLTPQQRRGMLFFAIAARIYLLFVLLGIFAVLLVWARPYHAENLVYTLGVFTVAGILFSPLKTIWRLASNPTVQSRLRWRRVGLLLVGVFAVIGLLLFWPINQSVTGYAVFIPSKGQTVYATAAGELQYAVHPGAHVQAGDVLARLSSSENKLALERQKGEYEVRRIHYEQLGALRAWNKQSSQQLPTARVALENAQAQLEELCQKAEQLTLRASRSGTVIAPPPIENENFGSDRLPTWGGLPLDSQNIGCWIEPGTVLCTIGDPKNLEALVAISQDDIAEIGPGHSVRILLVSAPVRVLEGTVIEVAHLATLQTTEDSAIATGKYHLVHVQLNRQDLTLLAGARGIAKIEARRSTLSTISYRTLQQMLRLPW